MLSFTLFFEMRNLALIVQNRLETLIENPDAVSVELRGLATRFSRVFIGLSVKLAKDLSHGNCNFSGQNSKVTLIYN